MYEASVDHSHQALSVLRRTDRFPTLNRGICAPRQANVLKQVRHEDRLVCVLRDDPACRAARGHADRFAHINVRRQRQRHHRRRHIIRREITVVGKCLDVRVDRNGVELAPRHVRQAAALAIKIRAADRTEENRIARVEERHIRREPRIGNRADDVRGGNVRETERAADEVRRRESFGERHVVRQQRDVRREIRVVDFAGDVRGLNCSAVKCSAHGVGRGGDLLARREHVESICRCAASANTDLQPTLVAIKRNASKIQRGGEIAIGHAHSRIGQRIAKLNSERERVIQREPEIKLARGWNAV